MDFTAIICTYNRAANLPLCIGALARQQGHDHIRWEILVVDNNSSDPTQATVEKLAREVPIPIRYVQEPQQGLNYARNTGIRSSSSSYFAYVDDDIEVSPQWLASIYDSFRRHDADAVGGRIHLNPATVLPPWIQSDEMKGFLGYQDFGEEAFAMDGKRRYPFGGNMAFHRRVVERIGFFNPLLGRKGAGTKRAELFKGAETDFFHRLAATGEARIFYAPKAIVYHQVQPFQLSKKYLRTIHYNAGYQHGLYDQRVFEKTLFGVPRFYYGQLISAVVNYLSEAIRSGTDLAFRKQMTVGHLIGTMLGLRQGQLRRASGE